MEIAELVAKRATCDRRHVGSVLVRERRILTTGYNGAPRGLPECDAVGHMMKVIDGRESCVRTVHAEANAILNAAYDGIAIKGAELYVTCLPCYDCSLLLANVKIRRIVVGEYYESRMSSLTDKVLAEAGIRLEFLR